MGSPLWLLPQSQPVMAFRGGSEAAGVGCHCGHLWLSWVGGHGPAAQPASVLGFPNVCL